MDANKILGADLVDLIFDGRNKSYGAYELRTGYNKRLRNSLLLTVAIGLLILLLSYISSLDLGEKLAQLSR
jgi:protein TonB